MSVHDSRVTPANGRVAAVYLEGAIEAQSYVEGTMMQCLADVADIVGAPGGSRTSQLICGDQFLVLEDRDGHAFGQSLHDGYCGYVDAERLGDVHKATHWVAAPQTHLYPDADMKLITRDALYFGSELFVDSIDGAWANLGTGQYVPSSHLLPTRTRLDDLAGVADLFLGTPYLWGGNTRFGIDCSGLVQLAFRGCGLDCPRDSDMQEAEIGRVLEDGEDPKRGDLVFWKGHVGVVTKPNMMLHANAFHMATVYEPLDEAVARIEEAGNGPITSIKRP